MPYWGFAKAMVTQWNNSITICGVNMDLNEVEDGMDNETRAAIGAILTQLGKLGLENRRLTEDVRGTFGYVFDHISVGHNMEQDEALINAALVQLDARIDALDTRLAAGAAELVRAGKALGEP